MKKRIALISIVLLLTATLLTGCITLDINTAEIPFIGRINEGKVDSNDNNKTTPNIKDTEVNIEVVPSPVESKLIDMIGRIHPSVVEINAVTPTGTSAGSGVIVAVSEYNSYIITCQHVVENATSIKILLTNGETYTGIYMGGVADQDIAVLKFQKTSGITPAKVRDLELSHVKMGEDAIAIGNPLGTLGGTVTMGIISSTAREINVEGTVMTLLQVDASINSGNSGGGLFDINGNLMGIVNAKAVGSDVEGLGFAIPADTALSIAENIIATSNDPNNPYNNLGYINGKFMLGVTVLLEKSGNNYYYSIKGVDKYGSLRGELQEGDRITAVNGVSFNENVTLQSVLSGKKIGDKLNISYAKRTSSNTYTNMNKTFTLKQYVYGYVHP